MGYCFVSTQFKSEPRETYQEYFLTDFENQKSLIVSKSLNSDKIEIFKATTNKEKISTNPIKTIASKGATLNSILREVGLDGSNIPQEANLVSHSPPFHADDLMACALVGKYYESQGIPYSITLTRDQEIINKADAVVDVGGVHDPKKLRFDHHQLKASSKAATGLVAEFLKDKEGFDWVYGLNSTLEKIDKADLGTMTSPEESKVSEALCHFNPTWKETQNHQFFQALNVLNECLENSLSSIETRPKESMGELFEKQLLNHPTTIQREFDTRTHQTEGSQKFIAAALKGQKSGITKTQQGIDFYPLLTKDYLKSCPPSTRRALESIKYITFKTPQGAINAIAAPKAENRMEQKHPFPQEWRGKRGQELVDAISKSTGENFPPVPQDKANEYFCHGAGFFLTAPDKATFNKAINYCATLAKAKEDSIKQNDLQNGVIKGESPLEVI
jgi:uncharacterized UPF0160 family protein